MKTCMAIAVAALVLVPQWAEAGDTIRLFRSVEDPNHPPNPAVCQSAPFAANVQLGASLYSVRTKKKNARVADDTWKKVGTATACLELTNVMFPQGLDQKFYVEFNLPDGKYVANGTCKVISNQVPLTFVILAGCSLSLVSGPSGVIGGSVTSSSVFNPLKRPGFNTGSYWTLLAYDDGTGTNAGPGQDEGEED